MHGAHPLNALHEYPWCISVTESRVRDQPIERNIGSYCVAKVRLCWRSELRWKYWSNIANLGNIEHWSGVLGRGTDTPNFVCRGTSRQHIKIPRSNSRIPSSI